MALFPSLESLVHASPFSKYLRISNPSDHSDSKSYTPSRYQAREGLYQAWSTTEDIKAKAKEAGDLAVKKVDSASAKIRTKTGEIQLYSPQYYAACTFGGLLACVRNW